MRVMSSSRALPWWMVLRCLIKPLASFRGFLVHQVHQMDLLAKSESGGASLFEGGGGAAGGGRGCWPCVRPSIQASSWLEMIGGGAPGVASGAGAVC